METPGGATSGRVNASIVIVIIVVVQVSSGLNCRDKAFGLSLLGTAILGFSLNTIGVINHRIQGGSVQISPTVLATGFPSQ